jgi:cytochrome oxidase assembly protein ShyY1
MDFENNAGLIEMAFVYAIILGFGIWQVVSIRRTLRRDQEAREQPGPSEPPKT